MCTIRLKCFEKTLKTMKGQRGNPYEFTRKEDMVNDYIPVAALDKYKTYIRFSMVASSKEKGNRPDEPIRVELVFEKSGKDAKKWNTEKMGILKQHEDEIKKAFDDDTEIIWKPKAGRGVAQKIVIENLDIKEGLNENNIEKVANWLAENMLKLANAVAPYAHELRAK